MAQQFRLNKGWTGGLLLSLAATAAPVHAQTPVTGLYIGGSAGITDLQDQNITSVQTGVGPLGPLARRTNGTSLRSLTGMVALGSVGYGLGNGLRLELEGSYRQNQTHRLFGDAITHNPVSVNGWNRTSAVMVNAIYDMHFIPWVTRWATPYLGIGVGYGWETLHNLYISSQNPLQPYTITGNDTVGNFTFQAMFGAAIPIRAVPGLDLTVEYRFFGISENDRFHGQITTAPPLPAGTTPASALLDHVFNHAAMIGLRYSFGPKAIF